jgi:hypothetical protein
LPEFTTGRWYKNERKRQRIARPHIPTRRKSRTIEKMGTCRWVGEQPPSLSHKYSKLKRRRLFEARLEQNVWATDLRRRLCGREEPATPSVESRL